jgi:glycosyltransferase involved in cell wall biosynthesis
MPTLLMVGKRRFDKQPVDGPVSAFKALIDGLHQAGVEHSVFPGRKVSKVVQYVRLFAILLRRWTHINVHLDANYGIVVGLLRPRSKATSITIHGYSQIEGARHPYNAFMHALQVKYLFRNRVYVSAAIRERVESAEGLSGGVVIPNAIDVSRFSDCVNSGMRDIDVFSLCGYSETKGVRHLLVAAQEMNFESKWVIAGHNYTRSQPPDVPLNCLCQVQLHGPLSDEEVAGFFARARVYVQPSDYESFGMPVLEAMAIGIPTVVSLGAGVSGFLTDGVDALLVQPGDPKALFNAIRRLLAETQLYATIAHNAKRKALEFSPRAVASMYTQYFSELTA